MGVIIIRKSATRPVTLADVLSRLEACPGTESKRRDLISAVNRACKMLNRQPGQLAANVPELRVKLIAIHPLAVGVTAKTLANIKANLARALEATGAMPLAATAVKASAEWKAFLAHADARHQAISLSRLAKYCSGRGVSPASMTDGVVERFREYLDQRLLTKDPGELCKATAQTWNGIIKRNAANFPLLTIPRSNVYSAAPLSTYPLSLQADLDRYIERLTAPDLFETEALAKALRPTTIRNIRAHIRQFLDAAVSAGYGPDRFKSLTDIVDIEVVRAALRVVTGRIGREAADTQIHMLATILAVGRHHVKAPTEVLDRLLAAKSRLVERSGRDRPQMTTKNMQRLAQFDDRRRIDQLVDLPNKLMNRAKQNPVSTRRSLDAMYAAAIAILLACPMRVGNLASLDIERNIVIKKVGSRRRFDFHVDGASVKNGSPIDFQLDEHGSRFLAKYLDSYRHRLSDDPGSVLFPRRSGGHRSPGHLAENLQDVIWRETGLKMNVHLFRHLAGMLFLQRHPGEYETVRRMLGHRKLETTMAFYARFDAMWASKRYDDEVLSQLRSGYAI